MFFTKLCKTLFSIKHFFPTINRFIIRDMNINPYYTVIKLIFSDILFWNTLASMNHSNCLWESTKKCQLLVKPEAINVYRE